MEDCIQALYDNGAKKVIFYAVGRTVKNSNTPSKELLLNSENYFDIDNKIPEIDIDDEILF